MLLIKSKYEPKYERMYIPIGNMDNVAKNKNYTYDYGHILLFNTLLDIGQHNFKIIHRIDTCNYNPEYVTYIIFCPLCSNTGDSITTTFLKTEGNIRFYLMHSNYSCKKKCNIKANLLCDQCFEIL